MKNLRWFWILFASVCLAITLMIFARQPVCSKIDETEALKAAMPGADSFGLKSDNAGEYYEAMANGRFVGYCIRSDAEGYAGGIKMLVGIDPGGEIKGVKIIEHQETPDIGAKIVEPGFLKKFEGRSAQDVEVGRGVDTISGATISSERVIRAVGKSVKEFLSRHPSKLGEQ